MSGLALCCTCFVFILRTFSHHIRAPQGTHISGPLFSADCILGIFSPTSVHVSQYACQWTSSTHHNIIIPHLFVPITRIPLRRAVAPTPFAHGRTSFVGRYRTSHIHKYNTQTPPSILSGAYIYTSRARSPTHVWYNTRKTDARGSSPLPPSRQHRNRWSVMILSDSARDTTADPA